MRRCALCVAVIAALAACAPAASKADSPNAVAASAAPRFHPDSGLEIIALHIRSGKQVHDFSVEVARSSFEQAKGLMFRTRLGPDEGMLFPFDPPRPVSFWMKNTVIPLDMVFIGADRRILNIDANAVPYSENPRSSQGDAAAVLELPGGRAGQLGIMPGDKVDW